ncbi:MAG: hypothetical protein ACC634_09660, partial [Hyphomicrobiales bacterium]
ASPSGTFAFEDITGTPWIEIDFAADIERAKVEILPRIGGTERRRATKTIGEKMVRNQTQIL